LGSAARRSALRKNRRFARAQVINQGVVNSVRNFVVAHSAPVALRDSVIYVRVLQPA